jgi:hypothetical protein
VIKEEVEIVPTTNLLTNLFLIKINQGTTLDERFFGQKLNLNKLNTFGSIIHVHVAMRNAKS